MRTIDFFIVESGPALGVIWEVGPALPIRCPPLRFDLD